MCTVDIGHSGNSWNLVLVLTTARNSATLPPIQGMSQQEVTTRLVVPWGHQPLLPSKAGAPQLAAA